MKGNMTKKDGTATTNAAESSNIMASANCHVSPSVCAVCVRVCVFVRSNTKRMQQLFSFCFPSCSLTLLSFRDFFIFQDGSDFGGSVICKTASGGYEMSSDDYGLDTKNCDGTSVFGP